MGIAAPLKPGVSASMQVDRTGPDAPLHLSNATSPGSRASPELTLIFPKPQTFLSLPLSSSWSPLQAFDYLLHLFLPSRHGLEGLGKNPLSVIYTLVRINLDLCVSSPKAVTCSVPSMINRRNIGLLFLVKEISGSSLAGEREVIGPRNCSAE